MHKIDFDLTVDSISKIEGHASIDLTVREGKVKDLRFRITDYKRFYTQAIRGKVVAALPQHVARICGTCSNAHLLCSIKAIEKALDVIPSEQTKILRKLVTYGLMIRDHALHLYLFALPDILGKDSIFDLDESDEKEHKLLHDAFAVKSAGNTLSIWAGGRSVHAPFPMVGGFVKLPDKGGKKAVIEKLIDSRKRVLYLIEILLECDFIQKENYLFAALDSLDYSFLDGDIVMSSEKRISDRKYGEYLEHVEIPDSQASAYTVNKQTVMVGALARLNLHKERLHKETKKSVQKALKIFPSKNFFNNNLAQAVEIIHSIDHALEIISGTVFKSEPPKVPVLKKSVAAVTIEAPRGILFYIVKISKEGKITSGRIVTPTNQNQLAIGQGVRHYISDKLDEPKEKISLEMEKVIRAFDPCMSCATHFLKVNWN